MNIAQKQHQVQEQCRVVAHLATAIAEIYGSHAEFVHPELVDQIGGNSAVLMNELGDILNGLDAATEDDEWTAPIFTEAKRLFPSKASSEPAAP